MKKGVKFLKYSGYNWHGKRNKVTASRQKKKRFTAKGRTSQQKGRNSRQKKKPRGNKKKTQGKRKNLTAKRIPSREK